jgi:hypothetical protein
MFGQPLNGFGGEKMKARLYRIAGSATFVWLLAAGLGAPKKW